MKAATSTGFPAAAVAPARVRWRIRSASRSTWRALWLAAEVVRAAVVFGWAWVRCGGVPRMAVQARCLQASCRRLFQVFGNDLQVNGISPTRGLLVCNHLSYLDILVLGATTPCVFVSKSDVRRWPVFGWLAVLAGTLFVRRDRRAGVSHSAAEIREALEQGVLVVLFPEGTSTGGATVLPFKSALFGVVEGTAHPVFPAAISYTLSDGEMSEEVCYWKDMTLVPHLWVLLGKRTLKATISFGAAQAANGEDRKTLALRLHAAVRELKHSIDPKLSA